MSERLALFGGPQTVLARGPHEVWPPPALAAELEELARQRNLDISIRGRSGPIAEFEQQFLEFMEGSVRYAVTYNSGTSGLLAAYFAVGVDRGVEVIGPALTYHAALSPVYALQGDVVLADIDPNTRCVDPSDIERRITERTRVLTVVHQWGHPADMGRILPIVEKYRLRLVEDCSHAHGSRYRGRLCGTFGDAAVFSLQTNKAIFAGEGGILVTNDQNVAERATLLGHYRDRCREEIAEPSHQRFWVTGYGLKLRMSPFNAIVAKHSLAAFPALKAGRHRCLRYFSQLLQDVPYIDPPYVDDRVDMGAWYGFKPVYRSERLNGIPRDHLVAALRAEGLEIDGPSGPVLSTQPLYSAERDPMFPSQRLRHANQLSDTPQAQGIQDSALSLPTFYDWERDKPLIEAYVAAMQKVARSATELAAWRRP